PVDGSVVVRDVDAGDTGGRRGDVGAAGGVGGLPGVLGHGGGVGGGRRGGGREQRAGRGEHRAEEDAQRGGTGDAGDDASHRRDLLPSRPRDRAGRAGCTSGDG